MSRWKHFVLCLAVSGCSFISAGAAEPSKTEMTVRLPPFVVDQTTGTTWRYCKITGYEILARCDDATTERVVLAFHRANQLFSLLLPHRFQIKTDVTETLVLYDEKLWPLAKRQAVAAMLHSGPEESDDSAIHVRSQSEKLSPAAGAKSLGLERPNRVQPSSFFSNLQLSDADSMTTFAMVSDTQIDPLETILTPAYVGNLVNARSPALPSWFRCGFLSIYSQLAYRNNTLLLRAFGWDAQKIISAKTGSGTAGKLPPIGNFLEIIDPGEGAEASLWARECELFVNWGMDPSDSIKVAGFWKFVQRCCTEPATESLFRECFGLGFAESMQQLNTFSTRTMRWTLDKHLAEMPSLELRDATQSEIARIKGEWERLETRYVRRNLPELEDAYLNEARQTLLKAFDHADRDPRLLATLGLLELDAHNKSSARSYLEGAVMQSVVRPRAYFELAQLRYDEQLGRSTRNDGKLSKDQADFILEPLLAGRRQSPSLPQVYELIADICVNCAALPDPGVLAALDEGVRLFPADSELVYRVAVLHSNTGPINQVSPLAKLGLHYAVSDSVGERFLDLNRKLLTKQPAP